METRWWAATVLAACMVWAGGSAHATTPQEKAAARSMFEEGKALAAQGNYAQACPKLEESYRIEPGIGVQFHLADCFEHVGKTASAWALFLDAASRSRDAGQLEREAVLRERAAALQGKLARMVIRVSEAADVSGLELTRDGAAVGKGMWGTPVPVDPGNHVVVARAPGHKRLVLTIAVADAANITVTIPALEEGSDQGAAAAPPAATTAAPVATVPDKAPPVAAPTTAANTGSTQRTIGMVVGGLGVVGLGAAAYFGLNTLSKLDDSKPYCDGDFCREQKGVDLRHEAVQSQTTSYVLTGVGGALLVAGVVTILTAPRAKTQQSAWMNRTPVFSLTPGGAAVSGRW